jgi:hypothetical protein
MFPPSSGLNRDVGRADARSQTMTRPTTLGRILRGAAFGALTLISAAAVGGGCLDRPVAPATPNVSARVVERAKQNKVSKIDLLFMIDNSSSMADKQTILAAAVPDLVSRLVDPVCVDSTTFLQTGKANMGICPNGSELDFEPVKDIHIGIISSSLGGHGSSGVCDQPDSRKTLPHNDDKGHLLTRGPMDAAVATLGNKPFLNWNPDPKAGGYADAMAIGTPFTQMVTGVGQHGCGYEASLESIYRFLVEPDPYDNITLDKSVNALGVAVLNGTDTTLLQQRADFLRPDSLVSVIMVTDENDCSIIDGGQNFYVIVPPSGSPAQSVLKHGTSACLTNPNDACCFSCLQAAPAGCPDPSGDAECAKNNWLKTEDPENLRCFNQKQRYGIDFLYPIKRYVDGFTSTQIVDRHNVAVKNPLYSDLTCKNMMGCAAERDKSYVFLAGIVGVPWQDIANDPTDLKKGYKTAKQINDENIWQKILGNPQPADKSAPVLPTDVHMVESVTPRANLSPPDSAVGADPINGHEWDTSKDSPANRDLQYACTFPLTTPKMCTDSTDCDCANPTGGMVADMKNPLCQGAQGYTTTQIGAKGYPGIRELQVLQGLNDQAIVASICPANVSDMASPDYGYRPAIAALISRLRNALRGRCLPRQLEVDPMDPDKKVPCVVIESFNPLPGQACACEMDPGRTTANDDVLTDEIKAAGTCRCEIHQLLDTLDKGAATTCQTQATANGTPPGWCYVDPLSQTVAGCPLVKDCPATDRRIIRFVNQASEPRQGATAFIMCQEKSFPSNGGAMMADPCAP